jgi:plasmid maintenance system antidote protein VapI
MNRDLRNRDLRLAILKCFDSQSDFAEAINIHESRVSQIIRGRRRLRKNEVPIWLEALGCDPKIFEQVTKR